MSDTNQQYNSIGFRPAGVRLEVAPRPDYGPRLDPPSHPLSQIPTAALRDTARQITAAEREELNRICEREGLIARRDQMLTEREQVKQKLAALTSTREQTVTELAQTEREIAELTASLAS